MTAIVLLLVLVLAGIAAALGRTPDSRDPEYSVGALLRHRGGDGPSSR